MWTRTATKELWRNCSQPYSFYHTFIATYWAGGPNEASAATLHRLCTLARKMKVRSFIVEDGHGRPDVTREIDHLEASSAAGPGEVTASVITFLNRRRPPGEDLAQLDATAIIGQAVIITFPAAGGPRSYIFEALWRPPATGRRQVPLVNHYVPISRATDILVRGSPFRVRVAYFGQQNGVTSVCAHSALRALIWYRTGELIDVARLNQLWNYDVADPDVTTVQVRDAMHQLGLRPIFWNLTGPMPRTESGTTEDSVWGLLTSLVESSSPSLLVISTSGRADHVVPMVGYTLNTDEWHPHGTSTHLDQREHASSSSLWVDHLVMHDDLLGPYFSVSRSGLLDASAKPQAIRPKLAMTLLPTGVEVSPAQAEFLARQSFGRLLAALQEGGFGTGRWWDFLTSSAEQRVFRTTLIDRDHYLGALTGMRELRRAPLRVDDLAALRQALPDQLWMCEVSLPNLFVANRTKLGELLISVTDIPTQHAEESVIAFRLPSLLGWSAGPPGGPRSWDVIDIPVRCHQPINTPGRHGNSW